MSISMPADAPLFLTEEELATLTGRRIRSKQIEALRAMLIPFRVNAIGHPVVTRAAVLGYIPAKADAANQGWTPRLAKSSR